MAQQTQTEHPARTELIAKGFITPDAHRTETAECTRCGASFTRIAGRTYDSACGHFRHCRRPEAAK